MVAISHEDDVKPLKKALNNMVKDIESQNETVLPDWDGDADSITGISESVDNLVSGGYL